MGTQLLYIDIVMSLQLLVKQLKGHKITMREQKKIKRTLNDIATLIPITILMLLPVSCLSYYLFIIISTVNHLGEGSQAIIFSFVLSRMNEK